MLFLINFLILVVILCLVGWIAQVVATQAGAPPVVRTIIWVVIAVILLIWLLNLFAGGVVFIRAGP